MEPITLVFAIGFLWAWPSDGIWTPSTLEDHLRQAEEDLKSFEFMARHLGIPGKPPSSGVLRYREEAETCKAKIQSLKEEIDRRDAVAPKPL